MTLDLHPYHDYNVSDPLRRFYLTNLSNIIHTQLES